MIRGTQRIVVISRGGLSQSFEYFPLQALLRLLDEGLDLSDPGTRRLLAAPLEQLKGLLTGRHLGSITKLYYTKLLSMIQLKTLYCVISHHIISYYSITIV